MGADELARRFASGDPVAFDEVVQRYEPRVTRLAYRLLGRRSRAEAEDVVQEVLLSVPKNCRNFRGRPSLATWLTAITLNKCRRHQRRRRVTWRLFGGRRRDDASDATAPPSSNAPGGTETAAAVRRAVQSLPQKDREVIVLRYFENLTASEIGGLIEASCGAVEVRLHRARARLAVALVSLKEEGPQ